jgi:hypothetical protein
MLDKSAHMNNNTEILILNLLVCCGSPVTGSIPTIPVTGSMSFFKPPIPINNDPIYKLMDITSTNIK